MYKFLLFFWCKTPFGFSRVFNNMEASKARLLKSFFLSPLEEKKSLVNFIVMLWTLQNCSTEAGIFKKRYLTIQKKMVWFSVYSNVHHLLVTFNGFIPMALEDFWLPFSLAICDCEKDIFSIFFSTSNFWYVGRPLKFCLFILEQVSLLNSFFSPPFFLSCHGRFLIFLIY